LIVFWAGKFGIYALREALTLPGRGDSPDRVLRPQGLGRDPLLFDNCIGRKRDVGGVVLAGALGVWVAFGDELDAVWRLKL
jgi:hypothetical protein